MSYFLNCDLKVTGGTFVHNSGGKGRLRNEEESETSISKEQLNNPKLHKLGTIKAREFTGVLASIDKSKFFKNPDGKDLKRQPNFEKLVNDRKNGLNDLQREKLLTLSYAAHADGQIEKNAMGKPNPGDSEFWKEIEKEPDISDNEYINPDNTQLAEEKPNQKLDGKALDEITKNQINIIPKDKNVAANTPELKVP
jgi:hypothetical protein